jgi:hypothetical protein
LNACAESDSAAKAAHLQMILAVIARMATNSFALKALSVTLFAGFLAYIGARSHPVTILSYGVAGAELVLWTLDAQYLRMERLFRVLYDDVRQQAGTDFAMDVQRYRAKVAPLWRVAFSWSVVWLYGVTIAATLLFAVYS